MQNVPKIVEDRLRVAVRVDHPDANVLAAFAEHSLPERERAGVMQHLASCGDCREVVALALPEMESGQTTARVVPSLAWPVWRWGFAIAGIVVIASFGMLQYQRRTQKPSVAVYLAPHAEGEKTTAQTQPLPTVSEPAKPVDKIESSKVPMKPAAAPAARLRDEYAVAKEKAAGAEVQRQLPHGPLQFDRSQQFSKLDNPTAAPSSGLKPQTSPPVGGPTITTEQVRVDGQSPAVDIEAQNSPTLTLQSQPMGIQPTAGHDETKVDKAKPAQTLIGNYKKLGGPAPEPPQSQAVGSAALARWNINAAGGLQRSFDLGATWEDVAVNGGSAVGAAGAMAANLANSNSITMERAKMKDAAVQKTVSATPVFRAVVANGADVWAGGASAALYHSIDAGSHWARVVVSSAGSSPTGDIVSLDFPDALHGKLSTSTSEVWGTSDGGQTWLKQ